MTFRGIPLTLHHSPTSRLHEPDESEREELLRLYSAILERFRPDVLVNFGGDILAHEVRDRARDRGVAVAFALHNLNYPFAHSFTTADAVIVPSRFTAGHYRKALGLHCTVLSNLVDYGRVRVADHDRRYLTFVNPSYEKGAYAFARIADELGRRRPDIPVLVVESRGAEQTLADCGLDLRSHGTVHLMSHTHDPRQFWGVTRVCLVPSLAAETQVLVAVEAMVNGIPVIGSDRGGLPETLGSAGVVLPLPERLTPFTRELPSPEEVAPWVEAVIRLWDDEGWYAEQGRRALAETRRWDPDVLEPRYIRFFTEIRPGSNPLVETGQRPTVHAVRTHTADGTQTEVGRAARPSIEAGIAVIKRRWPGLHNDCDEDPVFVLAAGWRSGSTMLQRLIMHSCFLWGEPFGHAGIIGALADPIRCSPTDGEPGGPVVETGPAHFPSSQDKPFPALRPAAR